MLVLDHNLLKHSTISLYYPSPRAHNKHINIQYQFLSLCRLQKLVIQLRVTVMLVSLLLATPALISWLWLVILPTRVAITFPEGCVCETVGYYVNCSSSTFNSISLIYPTNVQELVLYRNSITSLEKDRFISSGLTEPEEISFNDCEIETINLRAFSGLRKLALLWICGNRLREITPRTF